MMRAIYLVRFGDPESAFEVRQTTLPVPGANQVRIKVEAFGLNFADVMARKGLYRDCPPLPCVIGYDVVGRIDEVGTGVLNLEAGDRVTTLTRFGGYSEYVIADSRGIAKIPEGMPLTFAGSMATQYCTAYYAAYDCVNIFEGDKVLVHAAAGGVGTALVQLLKHKGAIIFGTCSSDEKTNYLKTLGVHHPINYVKRDYKNEIRKILGEERLDAVFDSLGGRYVKEGIKLLGAGGKMISYGAAEMSKAKNFFSRMMIGLEFGIYHPAAFILKSKSLVGVYMLPLADRRPNVVARCLRNVIQMAEDGIIKPAGGVEFPVSQIADAHRALESRKTMGKVMVKW